MNLDSVDGLDLRYLFCLWTGTNQLSPDHAVELFSIVSNSHTPVVFLNSDSYKKWELESSPFHPAFPFLSQVHKSDYLRAYLLHHYGGGYTDIKFTFKQWDSAFELLNKSSSWMLGTTVPDATQISFAPSYDKDEAEKIIADFKSCVSNFALICKKRTPLTTEWYNNTCSLLDQKLDLLMRNPGTVARDAAGIKLEDGKESAYPLAYTELVWVTTPIFYRYRQHILHYDIQPLQVFHMNAPIPGLQEAKKAFVKQYCSIWPQE
jgi:hypothetical protein